jgi:hypothetical protein
VNFRDIPALLKIIEDEHVDGVFTAFTDANMDAYYLLCEAAHLPSIVQSNL